MVERRWNYVGTTSDEVGISAAKSGSPENMVVAVLFATLASVHAKFQVVPVVADIATLDGRTTSEQLLTKSDSVPPGWAAPKTSQNYVIWPRTHNRQ